MRPATLGVMHPDLVHWRRPPRRRHPAARATRAVTRLLSAAPLVLALVAPTADPVGPARPAARAGSSTSTATSTGVGTSWQWPLAPPRVVMARFQAPAGPFAPGHRGVDLASQVGAAVLVAGPGVVAFAGVVAGRGAVSVEHTGGLRTTYEPVLAIVRAGDRVVAGQPLGGLEAVASHCAPAACLHWGLRRGETYLDPLTLVGGPVRVRLLPVW